MHCESCGTTISGLESNCPNCGCELTPVEYKIPKKTARDGFANVGFGFGLAGIITSGAFIGLIFSIIGVVFSALGFKSQRFKGKAIAGFVLSIIAILTVIIMVVAIYLIVVVYADKLMALYEELMLAFTK